MKKEKEFDSPSRRPIKIVRENKQDKPPKSPQKHSAAKRYKENELSSANYD